MVQTKDAFEFYWEYVKPLYCEIEARDNTLPVELLFEIHAAFDHLRRFYVDGEDEEESTKRAIAHLKRGALDAFKLKLKYYHVDVEAFLNSDVDLSLVDSGKFIQNFLQDKDNIIQLAKSSRISESSKDPEEAFSKWTETSIAIDKFYEDYFQSSYKIVWARRKTFFWNTKDSLRNLFLGFVTGVASSYLVWCITQ